MRKSRKIFMCTLAVTQNHGQRWRIPKLAGLPGECRPFHCCCQVFSEVIHIGPALTLLQARPCMFSHSFISWEAEGVEALRMRRPRLIQAPCI